MFDANRDTPRFGRGGGAAGAPTSPGTAGSPAQGSGRATASGGANGYAPRVEHQWSHYTQLELLRFLDEIRQALPPTQLAHLNTEEELLIQLHTVKALQADIMEEEGIPANQRAQVANTVASTLAKVIEMQTQVYNSERFKRIEGILVRRLSEIDEDLAKKVIDDYEKMLAELR